MNTNSNHNHNIGLLDININGRYANALQVLFIEILFVLIPLIIIEISVSFTRVFESICCEASKKIKQWAAKNPVQFIYLVTGRMKMSNQS